MLAKADDIYQQEDIMSITEKSGTSVDEFFRPKADIVLMLIQELFFMAIILMLLVTPVVWPN